MRIFIANINVFINFKIDLLFKINQNFSFEIKTPF